MKILIRHWQWITNSGVDCIEFWCSITLLISGIFLSFQDPNRFLTHTYFDDPNKAKIFSSLLFTFVGFLNLSKLFVPLKMPLIVNVGLKSLSFMLFVLLTLCELIHLQSFPLTLVFYTVFSGMTFQNLLKTR